MTFWRQLSSPTDPVSSTLARVTGHVVAPPLSSPRLILFLGLQMHLLNFQGGGTTAKTLGFSYSLRLFCCIFQTVSIVRMKDQCDY